MEFKRNIKTRHEIRRKFKKKVFVRFGPRATRDFKIFANNSKTIIHAYYSDLSFFHPQAADRELIFGTELTWYMARHAQLHSKIQLHMPIYSPEYGVIWE